MPESWLARPGASVVLLLLSSAVVPPAGALRVSFSMQTSQQLSRLQDFGTTGGSINVSVAVIPRACMGESPASGNTTTCWDYFDQIYLAVFNREQWDNLTYRLQDNDVSIHDTCLVPAVSWTPLSLLTWQEAAATADGAAELGLVGGEGPGSIVHVSGVPREAPAHGRPIRFEIRYRIPPRYDLYTLSVFNCLSFDLSLEGQASFLGGEGETLSTHQRDVLWVRLCFLLLFLFSAVAFGAFLLHHRATAVPLQALLVLVLVLRGFQQALLISPYIAASRGALLPAGGIDMSAALNSYATGSMAPEVVSDYGSTDSPDWFSSGTEAQSSSELLPAQHYVTQPAPPSPSVAPESFGPLPSAPLPSPTILSAGGGEWSLQRAALLAAALVEQVAALTFITALLAIAAGRHFHMPTVPPREREGLACAYVLFLCFGLTQEACSSGEVLCGVFVLSYQVVRILLVFAILLFLNGTADQLRRLSGQHWPTLRSDLLRLVTFRQIRLRLLMVRLVLPIIFLFLEVVLDWSSTWFKLLWRELLELYMALYVTCRVLPTASTYGTYFAPLRTPAGPPVAPGIYPRFFRWLLGSGIDRQAADALVARAAAAPRVVTPAAPPPPVQGMVQGAAARSREGGRPVAQ